MAARNVSAVEHGMADIGASLRSAATRAVRWCPGLRMAVGAGLGALLLVLGCAQPQRIPPPSSSSTVALPVVEHAAPGGVSSSASAQGERAALPMTAATFPANYPFTTFANRGIQDWTVDRSNDGSSLTCSFRSTGGADAHYGGIATPLPGSRGFRFAVTFLKGASAVRSVFVWAFGAKGEDAGRWGSSVRARRIELVNGARYVWEFFPGGAAPSYLWATPGKSSQRAMVHAFLDVDSDQDVSFRIDGVESEG